MKKLIVVGSGPGGLMAATQMVQLAGQSPNSVLIQVYEQRPGLGRKLLIAGSSGLNISHGGPIGDFVPHYQGFNPVWWTQLLESFGPKEWIRFIENDLKLETFLGTSNRYFVKEMKAANLLRVWVQWLKDRGVEFFPDHRWIGMNQNPAGIQLNFLSGEKNVPIEADGVAFFLGGGSWEPRVPEWPSRLEEVGIHCAEFVASNVGYEVNWLPNFLAESEGQPLKKIRLSTKKGQKLGELVITRYGLEGTPIYFCGTSGDATLDLKPDWSLDQVFQKLNSIRENLSPIRRAKRALGLCPASQSLLFHYFKNASVEELANAVKSFPIFLKSARPLLEAISSSGGVELSELKSNLSLKKFPRVFCGGEMLAWDAPTGGYLIQASVSQGAWIGKSLFKEIVCPDDSALE